MPSKNLRIYSILWEWKISKVGMYLRSSCKLLHGGFDFDEKFRLIFVSFGLSSSSNQILDFCVTLFLLCVVICRGTNDL